MATKVASSRPSSGPTVLPPNPRKLVTAAIDFGTSACGYAFTFNHEPLNIRANSWNYGGYTKKSSKAPASVLLNTDGTFHSFGFEAEEKYDSLTEDEEHYGWLFFEKFKMKLYSTEKLTLQTAIKDIDGNERPAIQIFTMVIKDIKRRLIESVQQSKGENITSHDVFWILTVPAIWSDSAKHFMHVAANRAGITSDQLRLVLEPEAASFYCQTNCKTKQGTGKKVLEAFAVGFKYIIIDLGAGTVDIATHEVLANGDLREIFTATGDALGSCRIDQAFVAMMESIFKDEAMTKFKKEDRSNYRDLLSDFEEKKRKVRLEGDSSMKIKLPAFFFNIVGKTRNLTVEQCINASKYFKGRVFLKRDKLEITSDVVKGFFEETVSQIVEKIKHIIRNHREIDAVLAVGGFSESPYVKDSIKNALLGTRIQLLAPEDPGNHVMYGATLTNIYPNKIAERISRYSYGFRVEEPYDERKHGGHKVTRANGEFCSVVYHECIIIGRRLKYNETIPFDEIGGMRNTLERKFERTPVEFWCSDTQNTKLCVPELGCRLVGTIELIPPLEGWPDEVHFSIKLRIGEAEFCITVMDIKSGREFKTKVDFLRD